MYEELKALLRAEGRARAFEQKTHAEFETLQDRVWRAELVPTAEYRRARAQWMRGRHILLAIRKRIAVLDVKRRGALSRRSESR
jgi:hypothetical protein